MMKKRKIRDALSHYIHHDSTAQDRTKKVHGKFSNLQTGSIAIVLFVVAFSLVHMMTPSFGFTWDESVYVLKGLELHNGISSSSYTANRPIAMALVATKLLDMGLSTESGFRVFGAFGGAFFIMSLFLLGQSVFGRLTGFLVSIFWLVSSFYIMQATFFYAELFVVGILLLLLLIVKRYYTNSSIYLSVFAALLCAIAFYFRYSAIYSITIILMVTSVRFYYNKNQKLQMSKASQWYFLGTLFALLTPYIAYVYLQFDTGLIEQFKEAYDIAQEGYVGQALIAYIFAIPSKISGLFFGLTIIFGIIISLIALGTKKLKLPWNVKWVCGVAIADFLLISLVAHPNERFIIFPLALFSIVSINFFVTKIRLLPEKFFLLTTVLLIVGTGFYLKENILYVKSLQESLVVKNEIFRSAGAIVRKDHADKPCAVWSVHRPQTAVYTKCTGFRYNDDTITQQLYLQRDQKKYLIAYPDDDNRIIDPLQDQKSLKDRGVIIDEIHNAQKLRIYRLYYAGSDRVGE